MYKEIDFINEIVEYFKENLGNKFSIKRECRFSYMSANGLKYLIFDFVIFEGDKIWAIGEVKNNWILDSYIRLKYFDFFKRAKSRFGLFINLTSVCLIDFDKEYSKGNIKEFDKWEISKDEIIKIISTLVTPNPLNKIEILSIIKKEFNGLKDEIIKSSDNSNFSNKYSNTDQGLLNSLDKFFENLTEEDIDGENEDIGFNEEKELEFFDLIIEDSNDEDFCRYVTFQSLFRTLTKNTWSMAGLVGMNDKSETFYVESLLNNNIPIKLDQKNITEIENLNSYFINSLSPLSLSDSLMMWRFYGDDGKGVCFHFKLNKNQLQSDFKLKKIRYINENSVVTLVLKSLINFRIKSNSFRLRQIDLWQHFLKPDCFKEEEEVRLLLINKRQQSQIIIPEWINNYTYGLIHPIVVFDSTKKMNINYPLKLEKIILGPKVSEMDVNMAQIKLLLNKIGFSSVTVEYSKQLYYR